MLQKVKVEPSQVCYISLGSNMGDSRKLLAEAIKMLTGRAGLQLLAASRVFCTEPQGYAEQPWFFNQVIKIESRLAPEALLAELHRIENKLGRVRTARRFGPRSMDLDILLYGNMVLKGPNLSIPHPRMHERAFVLLPLVELAPELVLPGGTRVADLLGALSFTLIGDKIGQKM